MNSLNINSVINNRYPNSQSYVQQHKTFFGSLKVPLQCDTVSFKGYSDIENCKEKSYGKYGYGQNREIHHRTCFFRNIETLKFIKDELQKRFPEGTQIWDYGCSDGEESLSLAMLFNPDPDKIDNRYKIKGFDLNPDLIKRINKGIYSIFDSVEKYTNDGFLLKKDSGLSKNQRELKKIFNRYLVKTEKPLDLSFNNEKKIKSDGEEVYFRLKNKAAFKDILEFQIGEQIGDITNIAKKEVESGNKPGAVIFKNSWYHLTGNAIKPFDDRTVPFDELKFDLLEQTIKGISEKLEDKGLLVVGNICFDHLFYKDSDNKELVKPNPFHEILKKYNFKPVKWERIPAHLPFLEKQEILVPTVWEKVTQSE